MTAFPYRLMEDHGDLQAGTPLRLFLAVTARELGVKLDRRAHGYHLGDRCREVLRAAWHQLGLREADRLLLDEVVDLGSGFVRVGRSARAERLCVAEGHGLAWVPVDKLRRPASHSQRARREEAKLTAVRSTGTADARQLLLGGGEERVRDRRRAGPARAKRVKRPKN